MSRCWVIAFALGLLAVAAPAHAQCTVNATGLAFGSYDVYAPAPLDATGTVTIRCLLASVEVRLTRGSSPTFMPRTMRQAAQVLSYNIYRDAARTNVWGDGTGGTSYFTGLVFLVRTVTMYGRAPAAQDVPAGNYADTVTAVVNF